LDSRALETASASSWVKQGHGEREVFSMVFGPSGSDGISDNMPSEGGVFRRIGRAPQVLSKSVCMEVYFNRLCRPGLGIFAR